MSLCHCQVPGEAGRAAISPYYAECRTSARSRIGWLQRWATIQGALFVVTCETSTLFSLVFLPPCASCRLRLPVSFVVHSFFSPHFFPLPSLSLVAHIAFPAMPQFYVFRPHWFRPSQSSAARHFTLFFPGTSSSVIATLASFISFFCCSAALRSVFSRHLFPPAHFHHALPRCV